jgi:hypothetical protein
VSRSSELLEPPTAAVYHIAATRTITQPRHTYPAPSPPATPYPPVPTFLWSNGAHEYGQLLTFGSTQTVANDPIAVDDANRNQYTPVEWSFLTQLQDYCRGDEDLRKGITIPGELCAGQYLEILGEERRVSHRFPKIESLFSRAARTWPTSIFSLFSLFTPTPYNKRGIYAQPSKPQLPTPEASSDDSLPSLDTDISSSDPNDSTDATSDDDWAYPPTPPPLPSFEIPQITIRPLSAVPENPELGLPALELPLRQFEDLQVDSSNASELGKGDGDREDDTRNVPDDVEMEPVNTLTHSASSGTREEDDAEDIYKNRPTSTPPIDALVATPASTEEDELAQEEPNDETFRREFQLAALLENERGIINEPPRSYYQQQSRAAMSRTLRRILTHVIPLISTRFGSRTSFRAIHRLREVIPQHQFDLFFREYGSYVELAKSISAAREDQRNVPNRWQVHLPRIRRIRQLITQYIDDADTLVKHHGYLDGLREYVVQHKVDFWNIETQGVLYHHEAQYLYALQHFLANESYSDLASRTQRLLQSRFEYPSDLWALVYTILGRLDPPSYEFELDCHFEPRTDADAQAKRIRFEEIGLFPFH